ncbi:ankyrin repeat domain-containing protein [Helicobacter equorum]|uniref:ankyrin repeat domain-containing protein n=1 Tax=Helicobacter equorum TaxID=361872 RepID=UPI001FD26BE5|nr:ankyrin repeat domain-containing protein [Helicobacter equorum]
MEKTQEMFIIDTNCLLSSCELILNICRTNKLKIILPKIIIDELDKIKDDKQHKENRNAHKALRTISDPTIRIHKEQLLKKKNDDKIISCAKLYGAYIISEDKTFKPLYDKTLTLKDFREKFETHIENHPNSTTYDFFNAMQAKNTNRTHELSKDPNLKVNAYDSKGFTPLILAIKNHDTDLIELLCKHQSIDINKHDSSFLKMTPLAHAVQNDSIEMVQLLLKHKACAYIGSKGNNKRNTPFLIAC